MKILYGSADGLQSSGATTLTAPPNVELDFGFVIAAGDVNGDHHVDLIEGAPSADPTVPGGHLFWCKGSARGPRSCTPLPGRDGDNGTSALAVADLDGDGIDDIVQADVSVPQGGGGLRLRLGGDNGPGKTPTVVTPTSLRMHDTEAASDAAAFGASVDAGRIDGDDYADIVVGIPGYRAGAGAIAIVRGGTDGGHAREAPRLVRPPKGKGKGFGSSVSPLHLSGGGDPPDVAVAAGRAGFDAAVWVVHGDDVRPLGGLADAVDGSAEDLDLGRGAAS
jgi:hypothetical protein